MIKIMDPPANDRVVSVENFHILFTYNLNDMSLNHYRRLVGSP